MPRQESPALVRGQRGARETSHPPAEGISQLTNDQRSVFPKVAFGWEKSPAPTRRCTGPCRGRQPSCGRVPPSRAVNAFRRGDVPEPDDKQRKAPPLRAPRKRSPPGLVSNKKKAPRCFSSTAGPSVWGWGIGHAPAPNSYRVPLSPVPVPRQDHGNDTRPASNVWDLTGRARHFLCGKHAERHEQSTMRYAERGRPRRQVVRRGLGQ